MTMRTLLFTSALLLAAGGQSAETKSETPIPPQEQGVAAWDHELVALMPQIDACIALSPQTRQVSYAAEREGALLVRLQGEEAAIDCTVRGGHAETHPRDMNLWIEGESNAIFVRGPGENPGGECYEAPEVRDSTGQVLGWMLDPQGC